MQRLAVGDLAVVEIDEARAVDLGGDEPRLGEVIGLDRRGGGLILAVDGIAQEFSEWPDADTTDAQATMADDGARESAACL